LPAKDIPDSRCSSWYILIVCSLLYMVNYVDRQVLSITVEYMRLDLGLTDTQIGIIQTTFFMSMAVFAFPAAYLADRWSRKKAIAVMGAVWSIFTAITGLGRNFIGVIIPRSLVGIGEAGFTSGGMPLIAAAFSAKARARAMGVFNMAIPIGSAIGVILGGFIAKTWGWRMAFFIFAIPGIILSLLALGMKDYSAPGGKDEPGRKISFFRTIAILLKIPTLRWIYLGFAMQNITLFSFLTWSPAFVMRAHDINSTKAGLLIGIISLMAVFGAVVGGILADFWQKRNRKGRMLTATFGLLGASILLIITLYLDLKGIGLFFGLLYGILAVVPMPAISAATQDVAPPGVRSASWGMNAFCCYVLGGGWAPMIVGAISDSWGGGAYGLKVGLMIASLGGFAGAFFYWISSKSYPADLAKIEKVIV
jgi:MFS family permease